jgi:amidase
MSSLALKSFPLCSASAESAVLRHDESEPMPARTMRVNDIESSCWAQRFGADPAAASLLPATATPVGRTTETLPAGLQIVGAEFADLGSIRLAEPLAGLMGGFVPPPGY